MTTATRRLARGALVTYPPSFRARYGAEQAALVEDRDVSLRVVLDVLVGSGRAWLRPAFVGEPTERLRQRRQATVSTVWVAWCAVFVGSSALLRLLEDPPPTGFSPDRGGWLVLQDTSATAIAVGWLLVLAIGVPLGVAALRRGRSVRRAVLPPLVALAGCTALLIPLLAYAQTHWVGAGRTATAADIPLWWAVLGLFWLVALVATAGWGTVGFALGLRRAAFSAQRLRVPTLAAAALVVPMAVVVAIDLSVLVGTATSAWSPVGTIAWTVAAVLVAAVVASATSSVRAVVAPPAAR